MAINNEQSLKTAIAFAAKLGAVAYSFLFSTSFKVKFVFCFLMTIHSIKNFQVEHIYLTLSGCLFGKRRLKPSGIGTYLSR